MQPRSPGEREVSPVEGALDERNTLCQYWMKRSITQGNISRTQREHITCCPGVFLCLKTKAAYEGDTPVYFWIKLLLFLEHLEKKGTHKCSSEELYVITVTCAFTYSLLRGLRKGSWPSGMETWHPFKKTIRDFCFNSNGCGFVSVFFSDLTKCYAPINCIKTIHITNNRYNHTQTRNAIMYSYMENKYFLFPPLSKAASVALTSRSYSSPFVDALMKDITSGFGGCFIV